LRLDTISNRHQARFATLRKFNRNQSQNKQGKTMSKLIKSRRAYKCHGCKSEISKGDFYSRKSIRLGSNKPDEVLNINGQATIISHGLTVAVKNCAKCA
jgi:hypothetical protein